MNPHPTRKQLQLGLLALTVLSWIVYAWLVIEQQRLCETVDPECDTGVSFGYVALVHFGAPLLCGASALAIGGAYWLGRGKNPERSANRAA